MMYRLVLLALLALTGLAPRQGAVAAEAAPKEDCFDCHGDKTLWKTNAAGVALHLFVDAAKFTNSVHKAALCRSCHADLTTKHPDDNIVPKQVNCGSCHTNENEIYKTSIHGVSLAMGASAAANWNKSSHCGLMNGAGPSGMPSDTLKISAP